MKVYFTGAGPGDPELLTLKARDLLETAQCCIWAGSLVNPALLDLLPATCRRHDSARMDLDEIMAVIYECRDQGLDVVRLHTGEPSLYGAIGEQMRRLNAANIDYEVIPGISSFQAAAAALRVELTAPEISQAVILTRTSGRTPLPPAQKLASLACAQATLCIFLSTHKLSEVADILIPHYGKDCPAALVYHASWPDEQVICGTLNNLPDQAGQFKRTAMILVGQALGQVGRDSKLYDAAFSHGYRKAHDHDTEQ